MSDTQLRATELLCQLLEQQKPEINGLELLQGQSGDAGRELLRERLLIMGPGLTWVTCPECGVALARVDRETGKDQVLLRCDDCGDTLTSREITRSYRVSLPKVLNLLSIGLNLQPASQKVIDADRAWRLGSVASSRKAPLTWYFSRHLHDPTVAKRVLEQMRADQASHSAKILTTSEVPLPEGSPLYDYAVVQLCAVGRVSKSSFTFFPERAQLPVENVAEDPACHTSLRYVRKHGVAYVEGERYVLEPMQAKILIALMDYHDHQMAASELRDRCGSDAAPFQPVKFFGRNSEVYKAFLRWVPSDKIYELIIYPEDMEWL